MNLKQLRAGEGITQEKAAKKAKLSPYLWGVIEREEFADYRSNIAKAFNVVVTILPDGTVSYDKGNAK